MLKELPIATRTLIIINVAVFILSFLLSMTGGTNLQAILGSYYPESPLFHFWQPFTHLFVHAGIAHLLFNMFALFMFGGAIENILGTKRFLILYFLAGIGSFLLFNLQSYFSIASLKSEIFSLGISPSVLQQITDSIQINQFGDITGSGVINQLPILYELVGEYVTPMVGASGAIYGVLIAFGFFFPNAQLVFFFIPYPVKAKYFIPGIIILEIILGFLNLSWNPVAHFAHLGGAAAGFLLILYWRKRGLRL